MASCTGSLHVQNEADFRRPQRLAGLRLEKTPSGLLIKARQKGWPDLLPCLIVCWQHPAIGEEPIAMAPNVI